MESHLNENTSWRPSFGIGKAGLLYSEMRSMRDNPVAQSSLLFCSMIFFVCFFIVCVSYSLLSRVTCIKLTPMCLSCIKAAHLCTCIRRRIGSTELGPEKQKTKYFYKKPISLSAQKVKKKQNQNQTKRIIIILILKLRWLKNYLYDRTHSFSWEL